MYLFPTTSAFSLSLLQCSRLLASFFAIALVFGFFSSCRIYNLYILCLYFLGLRTYVPFKNFFFTYIREMRLDGSSISLYNYFIRGASMGGTIIPPQESVYTQHIFHASNLDSNSVLTDQFVKGTGKTPNSIIYSFDKMNN
jgi:hypothetical protein